MNNPCDTCQEWLPNASECGLYGHQSRCGMWRDWHIFDVGYQEGLSQAESKVRQREREIVEWLKNYAQEFAGLAPTSDKRVILHATYDLMAWLGGGE